MRAPVVVLLLLAACNTGTIQGDDTSVTGDDTGGDPAGDAVVERLGLRGGATVDPDAGTWTGTTVVYDALVDDEGRAVETLCELSFTSTGEPFAPAVPCATCLFSYAVTHVDAGERVGPGCDAAWPDGHPGTTPAFWDAVLGYDPTGADGGPALMVYVAGSTDSTGTYHPPSWEASPRADRPWGGATWDAPTFTFDRPIADYPLAD